MEQTTADDKIKQQCIGVFNIDKAVITFKILSGTAKDYYYSIQAKALSQNF
jgi:hypothetical protein